MDFDIADIRHALVLEPQNKFASVSEKRLRKLISWSLTAKTDDIKNPEENQRSNNVYVKKAEDFLKRDTDEPCWVTGSLSF